MINSTTEPQEYSSNGYLYDQFIQCCTPQRARNCANLMTYSIVANLNFGYSYMGLRCFEFICQQPTLSGNDLCFQHFIGTLALACPGFTQTMTPADNLQTARYVELAQASLCCSYCVGTQVVSQCNYLNTACVGMHSIGNVCPIQAPVASGELVFLQCVFGSIIGRGISDSMLIRILDGIFQSAQEEI